MVWVGHAEVLPGSSGVEAHYLRVAAKAQSESDFLSRASATIVDAGFDLVDWHDVWTVESNAVVEPLRDVVRRACAHDEVVWAEAHH